MTVREKPAPAQPSTSDVKELDSLFYESVTLSEQLKRCLKDCSSLLQDESFKVESNLCREVMDQELPVVKGPPGERPTTPPPEEEDPIGTAEEEGKHEMGEDDEVTGELELEGGGGESDVTESDLELSDELTEVSSTASISGRSDDGVDSVDLEVDEWGLRDCTVTRTLNKRCSNSEEEGAEGERGARELSVNDTTKMMIDRVDKQVSCRCCRSVMGRIVHEVRRCESAANLAKLTPYQPKTTYITDIQGAVEYQVRYNREWYAALAIQRAWRSYFSRKVRRLRRAEVRRYKNEMRLKYGHIAHFVIQRDAQKL